MKKYDLEILYNKLLKATVIENLYINEVEDINSKKLNNIIMQKLVEKDRIKKYLEKNVVDNLELKAIISDIIEEILQVEEENRIIYEKKLNKSKIELSKLSKEKKLKQAYYQSEDGKNSFDKKK